MMKPLRIFLDDAKDDHFKEYQAELKAEGKEIGQEGEIVAMGALPKGMSGGRTSVWMYVELEDGKLAFAQTSLALFQMANAAFLGRYGQEG